ncbi:MAG TPA: 50S ribosomal protein L21 [Patescibacteria group bacterium]|nr:50S ribosomal protein L21 [Patescibacteria group bacterium]
MFAVIETGGKQYLVKADDVVKIEKLPVEAGKTVVFDKVLLIAEEDGSKLELGRPYVAGAKVEAVVEVQGRSRKVRVVKFKRKVRYKRVQGHRQPFTQVKIVKL